MDTQNPKLFLEITKDLKVIDYLSLIKKILDKIKPGGKYVAPEFYHNNLYYILSNYILLNKIKINDITILMVESLNYNRVFIRRLERIYYKYNLSFNLDYSENSIKFSDKNNSLIPLNPNKINSLPIKFLDNLYNYIGKNPFLEEFNEILLESL